MPKKDASTQLVGRGRSLDAEIETAAEKAVEETNPAGEGVETPALPDANGPITALTAYCKAVGRFPANWKTLKADDKRVAFVREFAPEQGRTDTFDPTDVIHLVANEVENVESDDLRKRVIDLSHDVGTNQLRIGGLLAVVAAKSLFREWGHDSFKAFVAAELPFRLRKAQHLVRNYTRLVELEIPFSRFDGIGWVKMGVILPVLDGSDLASVDQWVARAKALDIDSLDKEVKEAIGPARGEAEPAAPTSTKQKLFRLHEDQYETVDGALDLMKTELPTEFDNVAIEAICARYVMGQLGEGSAATAPAPAGPMSAQQAVAAVSGGLKRLHELAGGKSTNACYTEAFAGVVEAMDSLFQGVAFHIELPEA